VKLLRVYVLYKHGRYEAERLLHPSLVASPGSRNRRFGQEQAFVAWLYFMIFALSLTAVMLALSLLGVGFESGLLLATASLTTTGQLASVGGDHSVAWGRLAPGPQIVLCLAMVLGRVETLAFVALLNPAFWRR
jgi:trk system potassium uptake protein TrkH